MVVVYEKSFSRALEKSLTENLKTLERYYFS